MLRLIVSYIIYFVLLYLIYFRLKILNGTIIGMICGVIIFVVLTIMLVLTTVNVLNKNKKTKVDSKELPIDERVAILNTKLKKHVHELRMDNPFNSYIAVMISTVDSILDKHKHVIKLLTESFSSTDLTYINYIRTLDKVLKLVYKNLKGVVTRVEVFDYKGWVRIKDVPVIIGQCKNIKKGLDLDFDNINQGTNFNDYLKYIVEVRDLTSNNITIDEKLNKLIHELVCLEKISDVSLQELTDLIEQTKDYKNI